MASVRAEEIRVPKSVREAVGRHERGPGVQPGTTRPRDRAPRRPAWGPGPPWAKAERGDRRLAGSAVAGPGHRAGPAVRARREAYVETVLTQIPVIEFDLVMARVHARLWADLAATGKDIGPRDRLVAATAIGLGWKVASGNGRHFDRVPGLEVIAIP